MINYEEKYNSIHAFIKGRIRVLRPRKKDFREIKTWLALTNIAEMEDLKDKLYKMYLEYIDSDQRSNISKVQNMGFDVIKKAGE